jgi:predicted secreted protein
VFLSIYALLFILKVLNVLIAILSAPAGRQTVNVDVTQGTCCKAVKRAATNARLIKNKSISTNLVFSFYIEVDCHYQRTWDVKATKMCKTRSQGYTK